MLTARLAVIFNLKVHLLRIVKYVRKIIRFKRIEKTHGDVLMLAAQSVNSKAAIDDNSIVKKRIALVTGASGGIGLALVKQLMKDEGYDLIFAGTRTPEIFETLVQSGPKGPRLQCVKLDATDTTNLKAACEIMQAAGRLDLVINTVGILHSRAGMHPEKQLSDIDFKHMLIALDVNALSAMRLAIELEPLLSASHAPQFINLSARVGSIEDNHIGGWYTYRASKAALNMLLKTLAIEWARKMPRIACVALHPGTVATDLSEPFISNKSRHTVFQPEEAARLMMTVIDQLSPEQNGCFLAWDGTEISW
jgi:NAD(P)-dependent dehydrogenase (short-subunit alcohol dehydrogenase family)